MKRADKLAPGDHVAGLGEVEHVRVKDWSKVKQPVVTGSNRPRRALCPPICIKAKIVELRFRGHDVPTYYFAQRKVDVVEQAADRP